MSRLIIILLFLSFLSCEKVVELDLKESEPKHVIDAQLTDGSPCIIKLTESQGFYDDAPYKGISGARIILSDNEGNKEVVQEAIDAGVYISQMRGVTGRTYSLDVTIDEKSYQAKAKIPKVVNIDSLYIYNIKIGTDNWYSPCVVFLDPADEENYYYTLLFVNGSLMKKIYLQDDENRNGLKIEHVLYFSKEDNDDEELKIGDTITVQMQSIDKGAYTFYKSVSSAAASGNTNPISNFSGGILGCFKTYSTSEMELIISAEDIYTKN